MKSRVSRLELSGGCDEAAVLQLVRMNEVAIMSGEGLHRLPLGWRCHPSPPPNPLTRATPSSSKPISHKLLFLWHSRGNVCALTRQPRGKKKGSPSAAVQTTRWVRVICCSFKEAFTLSLFYALMTCFFTTCFSPLCTEIFRANKTNLKAELMRGIITTTKHVWYPPRDTVRWIIATSSATPCEWSEGEKNLFSWYISNW